MTTSQVNQCLIALFLCVVTTALCAAPCDGDQHRAFDFWLGEWQVHTPDGKLAGHNSVNVEYGGCVVHERYTTPQDFSGESLNSYDAGRGVWHQTWVDNQGTLLLLEGGIVSGTMVLEGDTQNASGEVTNNRISWTPNRDGSVRQHWQIRNNDGEWKTLFDGRYTRKVSSAIDNN